MSRRHAPIASTTRTARSFAAGSLAGPRPPGVVLGSAEAGDGVARRPGPDAGTARRAQRDTGERAQDGTAAGRGSGGRARYGVPARPWRRARGGGVALRRGSARGGGAVR
ncbi:hypothetical protein [Streptomyces murinus]|uniref:hypothetical protein n=1 Tax=Streptomyces murinus TaxID=33900 RepID=UPI003D677B27